MSIETKVGAFVLAGLTLLGLAIFLLGDFTFEKRYTIYVSFKDVGGLTKQSPVKLSGVEIGVVKGIELDGSKAKVVALVRDGVLIYRDSGFSIGSTGIIGSKFLQIDQGAPESGVLQAGALVKGEDPVSIEKALAKALGSLQDLLGGFNGDPKAKSPIAKNLNATIGNVRELTASLNEMMADAKPAVSASLERMDQITQKLDSILAKADTMLAAINDQKGPVGAMLHDERMKQDVKETVSSLKETAGTVKDVIGRLNQFRVFWNYDWRYEHAIRTGRGDIGLKIYPREGRYYYVGGSNLANVNDASLGTDYARKNTIDALLGFEWGWPWGSADLGVGVLRSGGGTRIGFSPGEKGSWLSRLSVFAQAYDFGRNRVVEGRLFNKPQYDFGVMVRPHRMVGVGARVEDVQTTNRVQSWINVSFEDKDVAHLFGMVSFGAAGTRGRSKSN